MSSCVTFQAQLASVMQVLSEAAVLEISKLVNEGSAVLRLEVSRNQSENELLRRKLLAVESELKRVETEARLRTVNVRSVAVQTGDNRDLDAVSVEDHCPTIDGVFGKEWCFGLWKESDAPAVEVEDTPPQPSSAGDKFSRMVEGLELPFFKDEISSKKKQDTDLSQAVTISDEAEDLTFGEHPPQLAVAKLHCDVQTSPDSCPDPQDITPVFAGQYRPDLKVSLIEAAAASVTQGSAGFSPAACRFLGSIGATRRRASGSAGSHFICTHCGRSFAYLSYLKIHQRRHSGEKPYGCTVCGKTFAQKTYLTLHRRTHTGEKPYSCPQCGRSFSQKSSLNSHLRCHTGEKPYSCAECGKSYAYKHGLNVHQCTESSWRSSEVL